jgi:hypothetical protein
MEEEMMPHDNEVESEAGKTDAPSGFRFFRADSPPAMRSASERGTLRPDYVPPLRPLPG